MPDRVKFELPDPVPAWIMRAMRSPNSIQNDDGTRSTVRTITFSGDGRHFLAPTIREIDGELKRLDDKQAIDFARKQKDALPFDSLEQAEQFSKDLSFFIGVQRRSAGFDRR